MVHERLGPDHPKVPEVGIIAVERLVRRPVVQGRVWKPVAQEDSRLHQLPSTKLHKNRVSEEAAHDVHNRPARTLVRSGLLRGVQRAKLHLDAGVETVLTDVSIRELRTLILSETLNALSGRNQGSFVEQHEGVH